EAQYRGALTTAADQALEAGAKEEAIEYARLLSRVAPLDPNAAILEAKVLIAGGHRPEAISVLTQHGSRIESELGSRPSAAVTALLKRLVSDAPVSGAGGTSDLLPEAQFAGRDRELGKLLGLWRGIEQRGAVAVITGASGIGKTRLLRELVQRISALGPVLLLWGQERHGNRAIPYAALADALRPAVNAPGVAGASQHLLAEAARLLPEIRDQFKLPDPAPIDDDAARIRFFDGVAALIDAVAFEQSVCVVVEDLHHASKSSIELLHFLTQRLAKAPVLFLLTFRAPDSPAYLLERFAPQTSNGSRGPANSGDGDVSADVTLYPLETEAVDLLLASVLVPGELDAETLSSVVAIAEGNPFIALDLIRRVRRGEPITRVPVELSQSLWIRLQSCSPAEQRLFLASALLGRPASLRLLAAATHLEEPLVFDAALALEQRGLIVQQKGGVAPAHDVLAGIALEGTGSAGRALLAGWTADALVAEAGSSNAELAQLYAEAGQPSSAHKYARAAILDAAASGAGEELDNLIALAALTALNSADRRAVQSLRTALRGDARRLGRGDAAVEENVEGRGASTGDAAGALPGHDTGAVRSAPDTSKPPNWPRTKVWRWMTDRPGQVAAGALIVSAASLAWVQERNSRSNAQGIVIGDSVVVSERVGARGSRRYVVTGSILPAASMQETSESAQPSWIAQMALP
ncbi:MAG TPA: AAA family ATPase, partial [Ramlibacter sp.]|nr:AAA family ATPase [Ramlibacter sp.]